MHLPVYTGKFTLAENSAILLLRPGCCIRSALAGNLHIKKCHKLSDIGITQ